MNSEISDKVREWNRRGATEGETPVFIRRITSTGGPRTTKGYPLKWGLAVYLTGAAPHYGGRVFWFAIEPKHNLFGLHQNTGFVFNGENREAKAWLETFDAAMFAGMMNIPKPNKPGPT